MNGHGPWSLHPLSQLEMYLPTHWCIKPSIVFGWKDYCNHLLTSLPAATCSLQSLLHRGSQGNPVNMSDLSLFCSKRPGPARIKAQIFWRAPRPPNTPSPHPQAQLLLLSPCSLSASSIASLLFLEFTRHIPDRGDLCTRRSFCPDICTSSPRSAPSPPLGLCANSKLPERALTPARDCHPRTPQHALATFPALLFATAPVPDLLRRLLVYQRGDFCWVTTASCFVHCPISGPRTVPRARAHTHRCSTNICSMNKR